MADFAELFKTLALLKDPLIIILAAVIVGLFWIIRDDRKLMSEKDSCIRQFSETAGEVAAALTKLSTLVEVVVYGRAKKT